MEATPPNSDLKVLSIALSDLRDSWVLMSIALKDHFADTPSVERDELMVQLELKLARILEGERGEFK